MMRALELVGVFLLLCVIYASVVIGLVALVLACVWFVLGFLIV